MKTRILFFITSLAGGGAEKVLVNMVNHLSKEKYDITVQTLFDVGVNKQYLDSHVNYRSVYKRPVRGISRFFLFFNPSKLYKKMIHNSYDIVVSYFQGPTTRIVAACPYEQTRIVQWVHNEFHEKKKIARCYRSLNECIKLQRRFNATIYVAESVRDIYLHTFPEIKGNDIVLYNVVESDKIQSMAEESIDSKEVLFSGQVNLISVGRFVQQKAFDRLIRITSRLIASGYDVKLLLLGSGALESQLKKLVKELGMSSYVEFLGYQTNPYKYVNNADLFVCSSLHEGFSTAVTESLIVGTPVITTECSGMYELLGNNEYGIIVDNDEEALFEGIKRIVSNPETLMMLKDQAKKRGSFFKLEETVEAIESFFDSL